MKTRNLYLQVWPLPLAKTCRTNGPKWLKTQRGDPWMKKYCFQKSSQIWTIVGLFFQIFLTDSKNIYISVLCIMHAPFSLCARYVHRAQRQKGACLVQNPVIYMFWESVRKIWKNEPTLVQIWELFWKKYFFIQGSPLCVLSHFEPFVRHVLGWGRGKFEARDL